MHSNPETLQGFTVQATAEAGDLYWKQTNDELIAALSALRRYQDTPFGMWLWCYSEDISRRTTRQYKRYTR